MFAQTSDYAHNVDLVMLFIVGISVLLLVGITIAMIYFVVRYNKKRNPVASQIEGNTFLEILWIVIPVALVLLMFYFGYAVFTEERNVPQGAMTVNVAAHMWGWEFTYTNGKKSDTLYLPQNKSVKMTLHTNDVNHGFYIPAFRVKEDIIAGRENYLVITPKELGCYDIVCTQYCGFSHSQMYTRLYVVPESIFDKYLNSDDKYILSSAGN